MAAKCDNVCLGHSGRKIAKNRGESKGVECAASEFFLASLLSLVLFMSPRKGIPFESLRED
jgi:hypothetical protein